MQFAQVQLDIVLEGPIATVALVEISNGVLVLKVTLFTDPCSREIIPQQFYGHGPLHFMP